VGSRTVEQQQIRRTVTQHLIGNIRVTHSDKLRLRPLHDQSYRTRLTPAPILSTWHPEPGRHAEYPTLESAENDEGGDLIAPPLFGGLASRIAHPGR
jgi:hypothetical protein